MDKYYHCEICQTEISKYLADFTFELCDFHNFCHGHKNMYLETKRSVDIKWDGEKFIPIIPVKINII